MKAQVPPNDDRSPNAMIRREDLERGLRVLSRAAAALAGFCEHVEHNEANSIDDAVRAAEHLRDLAADLSAQDGVSLHEAYAERIAAVEAASLLRHARSDGEPDLAGAKKLAAAGTWEQIQLGQLVHDRQFHPDVFGLSKIDQIRHYTFHVTKLTGLLADAIENDDWEAFRNQRLADVAVFGVKIATVCNVQLSRRSVDN